MSYSFRVKYNIQSLQTKNNPLFTHIKAYLVSDGTKRLVSEAKQLTNNHAYFRTTIEQKDKILNLNTTTRNYHSSQVMFIFQFESEEKFIKMGEAFVDLADIINNNKNGQLLSYKLDKCYDRNAKVWIVVNISQNQHKRLNKSTEIKHKEENYHIKSHHYLPETKGRVSSVYQRNNYTECSVLQNLVFKQDLSLISQNKTNYNPTITQFQKYTIGKTQVNKKTFQRNEELEKLQEDLTSANANLRLAQQQLSAVEEKYLINSRKLEQTDQKLRATLKQNSKLQEKCQKLLTQLNVVQKSNGSQKEQQTNQAQKYLKMYHESQLLRNKLLIEIQNQREQVKKKMKEVQKRSVQSLKKTKNAQKHEQMLKEDIKCCMLQIINLERQLKSEKNYKLKKEDQLKQSLFQVKNLQQKLNLGQVELNNLKRQKNQLAQELQISKFTINELQKEKLQLKQLAQKRLEAIQSYEAEIVKSNQVIKSERLKYSRQIQEIQQYTQRQQRNFEKYIEELQTKTINDYNKSNETTQLKRDIIKLNRCLNQQKERNTILQTQIQKISEQNQSLQHRVAREHNQNLLHLKQKSLLQRELIQLRQIKEDLTLEIQEGEQNLIQIETEELVQKSYAERDQLWKKQLGKVQQDTRVMIEKHRKQKQTLITKSKTLQKQLLQQKKEVQNTKLKITLFEEKVTKKQKQLKEHAGKIHKLQLIIKENESTISAKQNKISQLLKKSELIQELEAASAENQRKLLAKTKQALNFKTQLEKERELRNRYRIQVKEAFASISNVITKSQKQQVFYNQLRYDNLQPQSLLLLNTTLKIYTDKHNRNRLKLQKAQQLQNELDQKEKKLKQTNNGPKFQRKLSNSSRNSNLSFPEQDDPYSSCKLNDSRTIRTTSKKDQEQEIILGVVRQQLAEAKNRLQKQKKRNIQLQRQIEKLHKNIDQQRRQNSKIKQMLDSKIEELELEIANSYKKQKNIASAKQEIRNLTFQLESVKTQLDGLQKIQKQQKNQISRKSSATKIIQPKVHDESFFKVIDLEKRLRQSQQQVQKLKKQREQRKKDDLPMNKQLKNLELRIRQHESTIHNLKKQLQQERKNSEQQKEIYNIRVKKVKQNFQEEIQNHIKQKSQLKQNLDNQEERLKQLSRKNKILDENFRKVNSQLASNAQKEEKNKKMVIVQFELKIKSIQTQHENEISILKRQMEDQRTLQKSLKQVIQKKDKEIKQLKEQIDKKIKQIQNLISQCQIYGVRIKSLEEEQDLYKQTIGVLEKKIYESSQSSKKNVDREYDNSELKSNFSLKTFTFR